MVIEYFLVECTQVVIVPIWKKDNEKTGVLTASSSVKETLQAAGIKVKIDDSDQRTPGWKFNYYEMKVCLDLCRYSEVTR